MVQWFVVEHDNFSHLNLNNHTSNHTMEHEIHYANGTFIKCTLQDTGKWMSWTDASVADINSFKIGEKMKECHPPMDVLNELTAFNLVSISGLSLLICSLGILIAKLLEDQTSKEKTYAAALMEYLHPFAFQLSLVLFVSTVVLLGSSIDADDLLDSHSEMGYKCFEGLCPPLMFYALTFFSGLTCLAIFYDLAYGATGNGGILRYGRVKSLPTTTGDDPPNIKILHTVSVLTMSAVLLAAFVLLATGKFSVVDQEGGSKSEYGKKAMLSFWILIGTIIAKFFVIVFSVMSGKTYFWVWNTDDKKQMDKLWFVVYKIFDAFVTIALLVAAGVDISREGHAYAPLLVLATLLITRATTLVSEDLAKRQLLYIFPVIFSVVLIILVSVDEKFEDSHYNNTVTSESKLVANSHEYVDVVPLFQMFALLFASWKLLASLLSMGVDNVVLPYSQFSSSALVVISAVLVHEHNTTTAGFALLLSLVLKLSDAYYANDGDTPMDSVRSLLDYSESEEKLEKAKLDNTRTWLVLVPIVLSGILMSVVLGEDSNDNDIFWVVTGSLILVVIHFLVIVVAIVNDFGYENPLVYYLRLSKIPLVRFAVTSTVLCLLAVAIQKQGFDRWTIGKEHDYTEKYLIEAFFLYGLADAIGFLFM